MRVKRINPQRQRHRAQAKAGLDESGEAAHCETPASAVRSAPTIPKCGGDTTLTVNRPGLSIDLVGGGIAPCMGALLRARPRGVALGMSFPRGRTDMNGLRGGLLLMMQPAFAVVFWCGPERQQSGLAVLEEGHRAMRR